MVANIQRDAAIQELRERIDIVEVIGECVELKPSGKEFKGLCPFHQEKTPSFSVNPDKKLYYCYGCQASGDAIKFLMEIGKRSFQDIVADLGQQYNVTVPGSDQTRTQRPPRKLQVKPKAPKMPPPPEGEITLARLATPAEDIPQAQPDYDQKYGEILKTTFVYSLTETGELNRWVVRTQWKQRDPEKAKVKPHEKIHIPHHRAVEGEQVPLPCKKGETQQYRTAKEGETIYSKGDAHWEAYRIDEATTSINSVDGVAAVLLQEGEGCVELARSIGLASFTFQGSAWSIEAMLVEISKFKNKAILAKLRDHDEAGEKKAQTFLECCAVAGVFGIVVDPCSLLLPDEGELQRGADIKELLQLMSGDELIKRLEEQIRQAIATQRGTEAAQGEEETRDEFVEETPKSFTPDIEFTQQALNLLYGDEPWICVDNHLHKWSGTYYKHSLDVVELRRLRNFCDAYAVTDKDGNIRYPYAKPSKVEEALKWVKLSLGIDPTLVDPPGLNCTNGVLQIEWDGDKPSWKLIDHNPDLYYTYEPLVRFDPDADSTSCDRLLQSLDPPQREIFLRSTAASLDLVKVRKFKGRLIRGLLAKGDGNNGKDTLRECVALMYGKRGMTGCTLSDFKAYDDARKFPLSPLKRSRVNWATENANASLLDKIQSLKAFLTGDTLSYERKGRDEEYYNPVGIGIFNVNDSPNLQGTLEAFLSRWAIIDFNKTFKIGADPSKGEIEADPRFKYDPDFMSNQVLPAFLNRVLQALVDLMRDGINYSCTQQSLSNIQVENSHLFQFCRDVELQYAPNSHLTANDIWQRLRQWYIDNGTLVVEVNDKDKEKYIWADQPRKGDYNVKAVNQVIARFQQLFPKAKRSTLRKGQMILAGIGFKNDGDDGGDDGNQTPPTPTTPPNAEAINQSAEAMPRQVPRQEPLQDKDAEAITAIFEEVEEIFSQAVEVVDSRDSVEEVAQNLGEDENLLQLPRQADGIRDTASAVGSAVASAESEIASADFDETTIADAASALVNCNDAIALQECRQVYQPEVLKQAARMLTKEQRQKIRAWVKEPPTEAIRPAQHDSAPVPVPTAKFNLGDEVRGVGGDFKGRVGKIIEIDETDPIKTYKVLAAFRSAWASATELELSRL